MQPSKQLVSRDDGGLVLAAFFIATLALFLPTLLSYRGVWSAQPYTHGYLIAVATVWLVWRERDAFRVRGALWPAPLWLAAGLSLLWLVATIANAQLISQAVVPVLVVSWSAAVFGRRAARRLAPIAVVFLLAVPFWSLFTPALQRLTIVISGAAVGWFGIPAVIEGSVVHITYGSFLIAGGCAGLNYLMSGLTVGALYALGFLQQWRARTAVLALAAVIPIVGNWIRVASLIAIGHMTRMQSIFITESRPHLYYGWSIFFLGLLLFFPLARLVEKSETARRGEGRGEDAGPGGRRSPTSGRQDLRRALAATGVVGVGPLLYFSIGVVPVRQVEPLAIESRSLTWRETEAPAERPYAWQPAFQGADEHLVTSWTDGTASVLLDHLVYHEQSQGAELIGYTSRIAPDSVLVAQRLSGPVGSERRLVNAAIVRDGDTYVLVWYWYRVSGIETAQPLRVKLLEVWAFFRRSTVAELIAFSAACEPESCVGASQILSSFVGST